MAGLESQKIRNIGIAVLGLWITASYIFAQSPAIAADQDYSKASLEQLVDDLVKIDRAAPGISVMASYEAFIAEDAPAELTGGVLGVPPPSTIPQMRELVGRGVAALPILITHLNDSRPTHLVVGQRFGAPGGGFFMWGVFNDEYDPRIKAESYLKIKKASHKKNASEPDSFGLDKPFPDEYVVKVGDVCYALIGQIVNRRLWPVRYQATAGIVVNSPIESPSLADQVSKDWSGLDAAHHRDSLLADIHAARQTYQFSPAFARLRFYYPDVYQSLTGTDLKKRIAFETENKTHM